jgi:curved DNA-binding protein CbpA
VIYLGYSLVKSVQDLPPTHYALLGVPSWASEKEIKERYKMLARTDHSNKIDSLPGLDSVQDRLALFRQATELLSDPLKRAAYDR